MRYYRGMESRSCRLCQQNFIIDDADSAYYQKIAVPHPTLCPRCRLQRRLAWRNERNLYKRKSDKSGCDLITNFRPGAAVPVYHVDEWFKDDWDAPGLPSYDFNKGFFEQFQTLMHQSPHMHKATAGNEVNSEYINHAGNCKNCYFIFNSEYIQDSMYLKFCDHVGDCLDCTSTINSELCYECVNVDHGYGLLFSDDCKTSRESWFLRYCRGVSNSIFCYGLEQKQYHIFNEPHTKEQYEQKLSELKLHTWSGLEAAIKIWNEWSKKFPEHREIMLNCDDCTGDGLYDSKNAKDCFNSSSLQDCRYLVNSIRCKDSYDFFAYGECELGYEFVTAFKSYNCKFCVYVINSSEMEYCDSCYNCNHCFGCSGLNRKSYCIFNKQYSKEEYEDLVKRIKAKMREEGSYGEFFPAEMSYFPYEDSMAQDYFPREEKTSAPPAGSFSEVRELPDDIASVNLDELTQKSFRCPETNKLFRFQKQELEFYKKMKLPLPRASFEARYRRRNKFVPFPYEAALF